MHLLGKIEEFQVLEFDDLYGHMKGNLLAHIAKSILISSREIRA